MDRNFRTDRSAALANAVAHDLNDELTVILGSLDSRVPPAEKLRTVGDAALRCAVISRRLLDYAGRHGTRRAIPLTAVLDDAA